MARPVHPGPIVIPNAVQVELQWAQGTRTYHNDLHGQFSSAGAVPGTLAETLFAAFKTAFTSSGLVAQTHTTLGFTGVRVKDLRTPNLPWILSTGATVNGTGTGTALPANVCICVTLPTANAGKGFIGRQYLSGLAPVAQQDYLTHTAAAGTAAAAFFNQVASAMASNSVPMCVGQRQLDAGTSASGAALPPRSAACPLVTTAKITKSRLDSMRTRLGH